MTLEYEGIGIYISRPGNIYISVFFSSFLKKELCICLLLSLSEKDMRYVFPDKMNLMK